MKEHNEVDKGGGVKKFHYVKPTKQQSLPERWSCSLNSKEENHSFGQQSSKGFNLDSAWSIKRNVSVDQVMQRPNRSVGYGFPSPKRDRISASNSFYSRHKTIAANPSGPATSEPEVKVSVNKVQRPWQRGSATTHSNASSSPLNAASDDEFDFEFPASSSRKWNTHLPKSTSQSLDGPTNVALKHSGETGEAMKSKPNQTYSSFDTKKATYGSKYNSAFFDF